MWDETKQARLQALQDKEEQGTLGTDEELELEGLYAELDAEETARLRPGIAGMDQQIGALQQRNGQLEATTTDYDPLGLRRSHLGQDWWALPSAWVPKPQGHVLPTLLDPCGGLGHVGQSATTTCARPCWQSAKRPKAQRQG